MNLQEGNRAECNYTVPANLEHLRGRTAKELRELGAKGIPDEAPDCVTLDVDADGQAVFKWLSVFFVVNREGVYFD